MSVGEQDIPRPPEIGVGDLPFNRFLGVEASRRPDLGPFQLDEMPRYANHLGSVHVCAQFALAEACIGSVVSAALKTGQHSGPAVMRRAEVRFREPAYGAVYARPAAASEGLIERAMAELGQRGRSRVALEAVVVDARGAETLRATFEWVFQTRPLTP